MAEVNLHSLERTGTGRTETGCMETDCMKSGGAKTDHSVPDIRSCFQFVVDRFPVGLVHSNAVIRALWHVLFYVFRPDRPVELKTPDYRILVHPRNRQTLGRRILKDIVYEPGETQLWRRLVKPGMTVLDIGANVGHFSMIAGLILQENAGKTAGRVHAFEPTPVCFEQLRANLALNGLTNVTAHNMALSNENGHVEIFTDIKRGGHHSMARDNVRELEKSFKIPAMRLDDFVSKTLDDAPVSLIKMDTQGAEGLILQGAQKVLKRDMPIIMTEFWPTGLARFGCDGWALFDQLQNLGYQIQEITEDGRLVPVEKTVLKGRLVPMGEKGSVNLLLSKPGHDISC